MAGRCERDLAPMAVCVTVLSRLRVVRASVCSRRPVLTKGLLSDLLAILTAYMYLPEVSSSFVIVRFRWALTSFVDPTSFGEAPADREGALEERDDPSVQGAHVRPGRCGDLA